MGDNIYSEFFFFFQVKPSDVILNYIVDGADLQVEVGIVNPTDEVKAKCETPYIGDTILKGILITFPFLFFFSCCSIEK